MSSKEIARKARRKQLRKQKFLRLKPKMQQLEGMLHENSTWDDILKAAYECGFIDKKEYERLFKECSQEMVRRTSDYFL